MNNISAGIEALHRLGEVGAVDVGDEAEGDGPPGVVPERFVGHDWPEVRAADADFDDIADALAGVALPGAAADPLGEIRHLVENGMDLGHHVLTVVYDRSPARRAQGDVQDRAVLRDVDPLAPEHGIDATPQPRLAGELQQESQGLIGDQVLGVVEVDSCGLDRQPVAARAILGKELPEVQGLDLLAMLLQRRPGG
jgi:hypothetical protein